MDSDEQDIDALFTRDLHEILCVDKFIGDEKCRQLCDRILDPRATSYNQVKRIVLRGNCINIQGAQSISTVLKAGVELNSISIEWNQLGSPGAIFIAEALGGNTSLAHLDLRNNGIGDDGACALATTLAENRTLVVLDLRWNQINDRGALAFEALLKSRDRHKLTVLLGGNLISSSVLARIDEWNRRDELPPPPKEVYVPAPTPDCSAINAEVNKEIQQLRAECAALAERGDDFERQLNASALRVTELEHNLMREQFKTTQLEEALRNARRRIAELTTEKSGLIDGWDREREALSEDFRRQLDEKEVENAALIAEKEMLKNRIHKLMDTNASIEMQMERLSKQHADERGRLMDEMRQLQSKATELSIQESKLKSENQSMHAASARAADRIYSLETELKDSKIQILTVLKEQEIKHVAETDGLRDQFKHSSEASMAMITKQSQELTALRKNISEVEAINSAMDLEMQKRCDIAANEARDEEHKRNQATISDLRQRLELATTGKNELESRNAKNLSELMDLKTKHNAAIDDFQGLINSVQEEANELRSMNSSLRDIVVTAESENKQNAAEILSLQKRLAASELRGEKMHFDYSRVNSEVQRLQALVDKMECQITDLQNKRSLDFAKLRSRITGSIGRELDSAALDMGVEIRAND